MKKPSEIIIQKWKEKENFQSAILEFLDEEYERNKPCEHEETESWNDYIICKKCKIMW